MKLLLDSWALANKVEANDPRAWNVVEWKMGRNRTDSPKREPAGWRMGQDETGAQTKARMYRVLCTSARCTVDAWAMGERHAGDAEGAIGVLPFFEADAPEDEDSCEIEVETDDKVLLAACVRANRLEASCQAAAKAPKKSRWAMGSLKG